MSELIERYDDPGGMFARQIGNPIPAAEEISPTHKMHHVNGSATISIINPPWPDFVGPIVLLADDTWTWDNLGNIAYDFSSRVVVVGLAYCFYYDRQINKWYPTCISVAPPA